MTTGTADTATDARDTFPKLLAERARTRPDRPAYREKEYGIWQSHRLGAMSRPRSACSPRAWPIWASAAATG